MNKTSKLFGIAAFAITALFSSCKKEEAEKPAIKPIEEAMAANFENDGFGSSIYNYNYTITFRAAKAGKITQLGARIGKGTYNMAIIDSSSSSVLKLATLTVTDSTKFTYTDIDDVAIAANKAYFISINVPTGSNALYYYIPDSEFPITVGNFTYFESMYKTVTTTNAADIFDEFGYYSNTFAGIPGFLFAEN
jgi:hypothetical protein